MTRRGRGDVCGLILLFAAATGHGAEPRDESVANVAVQRGRNAVWSSTTPLTPTLGAWKSIWRTWGLDERPGDFAARVRERYGLHESPREDDALPLGLTAEPGPIGPTLANNCLLCHAGRVAGMTVIGLGNASLDLQSLHEDLTAREVFAPRLGFRIANGRGVIEASAATIYLLRFRDAEMNLAGPRNLKLDDQLHEDLPALWLMQHQRTMFHVGATSTGSTRVNTGFFLAPSNSAETVKAKDELMADMHAYLRTLEPPRYPFPIDRDLAVTGEDVFGDHCATCHGTYGEDREYPNVVIDADEVGTDPRLAEFETEVDRDYYRTSWLFREKDAEGRSMHMLHVGGYLARPLDGVWATAPYLHNGSVPTLAHLLDSRTRPAVFTRSYGTERADYDPERVGWRIEHVDPERVGETTGHERRRITDTRVPGRGNGGHTYGDDLSPAERRAVIEYLKTL